MDYFKMFYTGIGGLGLFFLGMKFLSEGLQSIAGDFIKRLIRAVTSNRFVAVIVGLAVTTIVQSSSVSTVMVVGLVNAGLMNLTQAIGVIFGANIGTTITGWILTVKIGKYGLLLVGLGIFPMLFSRHDGRQSLGRTIVALGLVFYGLETMSDAFKPLRHNQDFLSAMQYFHAGSLISILGCVIMGCVLTWLVQSSSAMLGITIALASTGSITYQTAAALVLGENIGTTITAQLAAIGGNVSARRAALSHALFNVSGVFVMIVLFNQYITLIDYLMPGNPDFVDTDGSKPLIAAHIALGHTLFNVTATLLALPFLNHLAALVTRIFPDTDELEKTHFKYIRGTGSISSGVSINMASLELENMGRIVHGALSSARAYVLSEKKDREAFAEVRRIEDLTDVMQKELTDFICQALEGSLSLEQTQEAYSIIRAADELESIADQALSLCKYRERLFAYEQKLSTEAQTQLLNFIDLVQAFFFELISDIKSLKNSTAPDHYSETVAKINAEAEILRERHLERMAAGICDPLTAMTFSDMIVALRRIKNHSINFIEAASFKLSQQKKRELIAATN